MSPNPLPAIAGAIDEKLPIGIGRDGTKKRKRRDHCEFLMRSTVIV